MRKVFVLLLMLSFGIQAWSQDVITQKNGEDLNVSIQEVTSTEIKYFKPSMPDGPMFSIKKSDVVMITYRDGSREVISTNNKLQDDSPIYAVNSEAITRGMKYKQLKTVYDYKDYDTYMGNVKYSLGWCGVASAFIPGLGQMIEGEAGRGVLQFVGGVGLSIAGSVFNSLSYEVTNWEGMVVGALVCYCGALAIDIWSIVDAVRIAKVKNMYYNDLRQLSYDIELTPYVNYAYAGNNNMQPVAGLSMRISF